MRKLTVIPVIVAALLLSSCSKADVGVLKAPCKPDGSTPACPGELTNFFNPAGEGAYAALSRAESEVSWGSPITTTRESECDNPGPCAQQEVVSKYRRDEPDFRKLPAGRSGILLATMTWKTNVPGHDRRYKAGGNGRDATVFLVASSVPLKGDADVAPAPSTQPPIGYWTLLRRTGAAVHPIAHGTIAPCADSITAPRPSDAGFYGCSHHVPPASRSVIGGVRDQYALLLAALRCDAAAEAVRILPTARMDPRCTSGQPSTFDALLQLTSRVAFRMTSLDAFASVFPPPDTALDAYWFPCTYGCCTA